MLSLGDDGGDALITLRPFAAHVSGHVFILRACWRTREAQQLLLSHWWILLSLISF